MRSEKPTFIINWHVLKERIKMSNEKGNSKKSANNQNTNNDTEKIDVKKEVLDWVLVILIAAALALFLNTVIVVNARIPTASMETTVMIGDRLYGYRLAYLNKDPERGDIVIFKYPDNEKELFIKRVIGLPGEKVEIIDGKVYINDSETPLEEPYVNGVPVGTFGPYEVPADSYFMMGDNRNNSADSRFWRNSYVHKSKILGKAWFRYYPNFKLIRSHTY